jgi:hypothetical protein
MAYTITSEYLDCDKSLGDSITEKELLEMGANIEALISAGHIVDATTTKSAPPRQEGESNA